jgi:uncharacterized protein YdeI (BOF family)
MSQIIAMNLIKPSQVLCALGCVAGFSGIVAGCATGGHSVRGQAPVGVQSTLAQAQAAPIGTKLMVAGALLQKCPVAGCWFTLHDSNNTLRVDTKMAGFTVGDIPLRTQILVQGKVVRYGSTRQIQATGIRY